MHEIKLTQTVPVCLFPPEYDVKIFHLYTSFSICAAGLTLPVMLFQRSPVDPEGLAGAVSLQLFGFQTPVMAPSAFIEQETRQLHR